jgi:hypothetical protein
MNDVTNFTLLANVMEDAAGFFEWKKGRQRLLRVVLNFSYRLGKPEAEFPSHEVLMSHTRLNQKRLSEAIADLVRFRVLRRRGEGKGGVVLIPMPNYQDWALPPLDEECADREYLASLIRYTVRHTTAGYIAIPYPVEAVDPVTQYALAYARGEFSQKPLIPNDQTLNEPVAEIARQAAASSVAVAESKRRPGRPCKPYEERQHGRSYEAPIDVDIEEILAFAEKLFGGDWRDGHGEPWDRERRDEWFRKVADDRGRGAVFVVLQMAQDFGPHRIGAPCCWIGTLLDKIAPIKAA